jgi:acetyl esterase/lipase
MYSERLKNGFLFIGLGLLVSAVYAAEAPDSQEKKMTLKLWPQTVPFAIETDTDDMPAMDYYPAAGPEATDAAVIVCPGGGYAGLALDHEGVQIAGWLNSIGVNAFILTYRLPAKGYRHPVPLADAQRAIRTVRYKAKEWKIDPAKIGILGFSAGGHLASSAAVHFDSPVELEKNDDPVNTVSCRPDFAVLVYPVISMQKGITHMGSRNNLLGSDPVPELVDLLSNEKHVSPDTPPVFLVHASDDKGVSPENSLLFYQACIKAGVPAEMHIYLRGGHGFGIKPEAGPACKWTKACQDWMRQIFK